MTNSNIVLDNIVSSFLPAKCCNFCFRGKIINTEGRETATFLLIYLQADKSDSSWYTCNPTSSKHQSILIYLTKGKYILTYVNIFARKLLREMLYSNQIFEFASPKITIWTYVPKSYCHHWCTISTIEYLYTKCMQSCFCATIFRIWQELKAMSSTFS